ncbi:4'-phosphopantetheinyl transferase family protein [Halochromatium salexigens]|uniref:4'-phosphopantetheinyl transferase n=1 Tax=Halochromatium salexigens TaxID=49447 RepID=A0AAJ0UD40_HALSE|nr:4'-phosphopantetheinyl transferase superfamily protein [Halochromatium salexigens]MBK5929299.1 hypothetical protein [Halochromatium salexigens]
MRTRQNGLLLVELSLTPWGERHAALLALLPAEEQARIQRYRQDQDRSRGLVAALLPRLLIARETGQPLAAIRFARAEHGKPYHADDATLHFNLSHSGVHVALAVGPAPVGVDVEQIRPTRDWEAIAQRFFAADEQRWLARFADGERQARFFELWSRKESLLKATGDGLAGALSSFSAIPVTAAGEEVGTCVEVDVGASAKVNANKEHRIRFRGISWHLRSYQGIPGCALALCARAPGLPAPLRVDTRVEDLIERTSAAVDALARVADDRPAP